MLLLEAKCGGPVNLSTSHCRCHQAECLERKAVAGPFLAQVFESMESPEPSHIGEKENGTARKAHQAPERPLSWKISIAQAGPVEAPCCQPHHPFAPRFRKASESLSNIRVGGLTHIFIIEGKD